MEEKGNAGNWLSCLVHIAFVLGGLMKLGGGTAGGSSMRPLQQVGGTPLFQISTLVYGVMTLVGIALIHFGHGNLQTLVRPEGQTYELLRLVASGALAAGLLLILSSMFEDWFASFRQLKTSITQLLGPCSIPMAIYLAAISSLGEELLFRGGIQPYLGLVATSLLFGLVHLDQNGRVSAWSLWATIAGLVLGWTVQQSNSLIPALTGHFLVNAISILRVRHLYRLAILHLQNVDHSACPEQPPSSRDHS